MKWRIDLIIVTNFLLLGYVTTEIYISLAFYFLTIVWAVISIIQLTKE